MGLGRISSGWACGGCGCGWCGWSNAHFFVRQFVLHVRTSDIILMCGPQICPRQHEKGEGGSEQEEKDADVRPRLLGSERAGGKSAALRLGCVAAAQSVRSRASVYILPWHCTWNRRVAGGWTVGLHAVARCGALAVHRSVATTDRILRQR